MKTSGSKGKGQSKSHHAILIPIEKLVPHESSACETRVKVVPSHRDNPIVVKPLDNGQFYIIDGTNRAYNALKNDEKEVSCVIATPDYSSRYTKIAELRNRKSEGFPLKSLGFVADDKARQHEFFLETDGFSPRPHVRSNQGTVVKAYFEIEYPDGTIDQQFSLPLKGNIGGVILNPSKAIEYFKKNEINESHLFNAWGDEKSYSPNVLPSYIELSNDGYDMWAAGFNYRQAFKVQEDPPQFDVSARGKVASISVFVLYPNGLTWEGKLPVNEETSMVIWSDILANKLADTNIKSGYVHSENWWENYTSLVFNKVMARGCPRILHTCGSTCAGGGCLC